MRTVGQEGGRSVDLSPSIRRFVLICSLQYWWLQGLSLLSRQGKTDFLTPSKY
jgi:hypothetical protein